MKILTVFTGGTIACSSENNVLSPDKENGYMLLDMYRELDRETEFDTARPYIILSENLQAETLDALYYCIGGYDLSEYDGVIVCHGTDTLQYTGAFLSYRFGLCKTPIVLVSANYPLDHRRSNGFENFCAAVGFIKSGQGRGGFCAVRNDLYVLLHLFGHCREILADSPGNTLERQTVEQAVLDFCPYFQSAWALVLSLAFLFPPLAFSQT